MIVITLRVSAEWNIQWHFIVLRKFLQLFNRQLPSTTFDFRPYLNIRHHRKIKVKNIGYNDAKLLNKQRRLDDQAWILWAIEQKLIVSKDEKKLDVDINNFNRFFKKKAVTSIRKSMNIRADHQLQAGEKLPGEIAGAIAANQTEISNYQELEEQAFIDQHARELQQYQEVQQAQIEHVAKRENAILEVPILLQSVLKSHRITATIIIVLAVIAILVPFFEITYSEVQNWFRMLNTLINVMGMETSSLLPNS